MAMAVELAVGYAAHHARHMQRASRTRTLVSSLCVARIITVFRSRAHDRHARVAAEVAALARSLNRARAVWR